MTTGPSVTPASVGAIGSHLDAYVCLYAEIYDVEPHAGDPFFSAPEYRQRLTGAMAMSGFSAVEARSSGDDLVAFGFGVTLPSTARWLSELDPPRSHRDAAEAGDVFWLRELQVRASWRAHGIGRAMHAALLAARHERWAALTVLPDNEPARSAYLRWGYECIGQSRHADVSPVYDVLWARRSTLADLERPPASGQG